MVKLPRALRPRLVLKHTDGSRFQRRSQSASTRVRSRAQSSAVLRVEGCDSAPLSPLLPPSPLLPSLPRRGERTGTFDDIFNGMG